MRRRTTLEICEFQALEGIIVETVERAEAEPSGGERGVVRARAGGGGVVKDKQTVKRLP